MIGYLLQRSPQDRNGFETFFTVCLEGLQADAQAWVFLRGDGVYQGLKNQRLDEPGLTIPVAGGWNALMARGVRLYVNHRCAALRGLGEAKFFLPEAKIVSMDEFVRLSLKADKVLSF